MGEELIRYRPWLLAARAQLHGGTPSSSMPNRLYLVSQDVPIFDTSATSPMASGMATRRGKDTESVVYSMDGVRYTEDNRYVPFL